MKNRILSVFCAIAMLATMMSAFVVTASAADAPTITMTVLNQATDTEPAEIKVEYAGVEAGREISGIQAVIPLDTTKFTYVDGSATGKMSYNADEKAVKAVFVALPMAGVNNITETSGDLGTFKLALAEGVEAGTTYTLAVDNAKTYFALATTGKAEQVMAEGNSVELSTGEKPAPTVPPTPDEPTLPETPYIYAKVSAQPAAAGEEVEISVSYANVEAGREISGIQAVLPIDGTKYTYVDGSATGKMSYNADEKAVKAVFVALPMAGVNNITETSGDLGTFKIKLNEDLEWGENIEISMDATKTYFALATTGKAEQVMATTVASTIVVGAGAEVSKDLAVVLDKTAVTLEPGASAEVTATIKNVENTAKLTAESDNKDVTVKVDGTKITVTAAKKAADGTANVTVTAKEGDRTATATLVVTVKAKEAEKPAFKTDAETKEETVAGSKVNTFEAKVAPAEGKTAEEISALITGSEYQVIFDGKTSDGYAAGWAIVTISGDALKAALAGDGKLTDVKISIGGADKVAVSILDAAGNTVVLPE